MCFLQSILFLIEGVREWVFETAEIDQWVPPARPEADRAGDVVRSLHLGRQR